ncbi:9014_t:CDS:2, partial [Acaulospora colombiana]
TYPSKENQSAISQALFEDKSRTLDYDGIATVVFPSVEAAEGFSRDPEHAKMLKDYPKVYTQVGSIRITAGEEVPVVELVKHQTGMSTSTHASPVDLSNQQTIEHPTDEQLQKLELKEMTSDVPSHEPEHDEKEQHEERRPEDQDDAAEPTAEDEQADAQPVEEETPAPVEKKEENPKAPEVQLRSSRKFKSVGNPAFGGAVGTPPPRQPSRFVTVGNPEYKTIKASITSIADIYKASGMTAPEEKGDENLEDAKEAVHETILEEDPTSPSAASYRFSERDEGEEHDEASTHYEEATTAMGSDDEEGGVVADKMPPSATPKEEDASYSSEAAPPYEKDPFSDDAQVDHKPVVYGDEKKPVVGGEYAQTTSNVYHPAVPATGPDL